MNFLWFLILACFCNKNNARTCKNQRRQTRNCSRVTSQNTCCSTNNNSSNGNCASNDNIPVPPCPPPQNQGRPCGPVPNQPYPQAGNQNCSFQNFQNSSMQNQGYPCQPLYQASEDAPCPSIAEPVSSCQRCN